MRAFEVILGVCVAAAAAGCGGDDGGGDAASSGGGAGTAGFGEDDVVAAFSTFTDVGFTRISEEPTATQHGLTPKVVIWVANSAVDPYKDIDPDDETDMAEPFPVGTIIVKQNVDDQGAADGAATVLAKFDAGFNAAAADWWWGRFDDAGALVESGAIGYCISCHEGNGLQRTDYLQGVRKSNQLP